MSKLSKAAFAFAAAAMVVAPAAVQAGTRAQSSPVVMDVQRASPGSVDANSVGQFNPVWLLLLLAVVAALVAAASGGRSRGG